MNATDAKLSKFLVALDEGGFNWKQADSRGRACLSLLAEKLPEEAARRRQAWMSDSWTKELPAGRGPKPRV